MNLRRLLTRLLPRLLSGVPPEPILETDGELGASELALETAELLERAGPLGASIFPSQFSKGFLGFWSSACSKSATSSYSLAMKTSDLKASPSMSISRSGPILGRIRLGLVYQLAVNDFRGERRAQLVIRQLWKC